MNGRDGKKLTLVVMAAGMGSRFGGLKQLEPVGPEGEFILEYSVYDAMRSGFTELVIIIKEENRDLFHEAIGRKIAKFMEVKYVFQDTKDLPGAYTENEECRKRQKPWGTGHAVLAARDKLNHPFMVINADDFYGKETFYEMVRMLSDLPDGTGALVSFPLERTMSRSGGVSRGILTIDDKGILSGVAEHTDIRYHGERILSYGEKEVELQPDTRVSMNVWGFSPEILPLLSDEFEQFLQEIRDPGKDEFQLPTAVSHLVRNGRIRILTGTSTEKWYGITYKEDKEKVKQGIKEQTEKGRYPKKLWEGRDAR